MTSRHGAPRITTARRSHSDEVWSRERRYIFTMGIRTACWLAAIVFTLTGPHWVAWLFVIGSLFLPYVAVVMANAGTTPDPTRPQLYDAPRKQIGPPRDTGESERSERDSDPF